MLQKPLKEQAREKDKELFEEAKEQQRKLNEEKFEAFKENEERNKKDKYPCHPLRSQDVAAMFP